MRRPTPPTDLTEAFRETAIDWCRHNGATGPQLPMRLYDGGPSCWLWGFDPLERPCSGRLEAFHFISRQRIRRILDGLLPTDVAVDGGFIPIDLSELITLAEWDPRNGGPGCSGHHRRFDSHATPELRVPAEALPRHTLRFIADWGLESAAAQKFTGDIDAVIDFRLGKAPAQ